jgi:DHA1 family inner membrane transport protein
MPIALLSLAMAAFAIGTTEFVVVGLLPTTAADLSVSVPAAGMLVTGYALGVAFGGPLLTALSRRWPRRNTLVALTALFAAGHLIMAMAPNFTTLIIVRLVTASAHGAFFGIGSVVAAAIVAPHRRGQAIAVMITGVTVANLIGVPGGTYIGQHTSWRVPFLVVAAISAAAAVAVRATVPADAATVTSDGGAPPARRGPLALALITTVIGYGAIFVPFTFVSPYLTEVTGLSLGTVTVLLLIFGGASALGSLLGGRAGDRWPIAALPATLVGLTAVLAAVWAGGTVGPLTIALMVGWGACGFALVPLMQSRVVGLAGSGSALASTLNIAAFNIGTAAGAALGGALVATGQLRALPLVGAGLTAAAAALALAGKRHVTATLPASDCAPPERTPAPAPAQAA